MAYLNFNGKLLKDNTPIVGADSRGLRYGDGLFETFKFSHNELILFDEHLARLWKGLQLLQFDVPKFFTPDKLQEEIVLLLKKNNHERARIRLSVFRGDGGLYDHKNSLQYVMQSWAIAPQVNLNENGLQVGIYREAKKSIDSFANCKHNNFLPYVMAALFAKQNKLNDALVLNQHGRICDSTIANIFFIKNDTVFTPPLTEGCIAGVMRKTILQAFEKSDNPIQEGVLTVDKLMEADEVFLTNSIFNIRWIDGIDTKRYARRHTTEIYNFLSKTKPGLFC